LGKFNFQGFLVGCVSAIINMILNSNGKNQGDGKSTGIIEVKKLMQLT
jgi:hypothetical protein